MALPSFPSAISMEQIRREMGFVHESNWLGGTGYTVKAGTTWTSTLVFYQGVTPTGKHIKFSDTRIYPITRYEVIFGGYGPNSQVIDFTVDDGWTPTGTGRIGSYITDVS